MRILISGICGFVGSTLALELRGRGHQVSGFDNFIRPGSEHNRGLLKKADVGVVHSDVRLASDVDALAPVDWMIDAAANPSVLGGVDGTNSSRQVVEHNLVGTLNLLEFCKRHQAGFTLLSTSRVYSIPALSALEVREEGNAFQPLKDQRFPTGLTTFGVAETFSTQAPVSIYGSTKLASECLALEYGETFGFPVWINRCGVLAGAGQFGRPDQGIFSFWVNAWLRDQPLKYIGFGGRGYQVRDCLHPRDLVPVLEQQFAAPLGKRRVVNLGGGTSNTMSLAQLSQWCAERFNKQRAVESVAVQRPFDIPWMVLDARLAQNQWQWSPQTGIYEVLEEIAQHAEKHPHWLELSAP